MHSYECSSATTPFSTSGKCRERHECADVRQRPSLVACEVHPHLIMASAIHRAMWRLGGIFASLAKKLQYPALATVPVSAVMLHRVETVTLDQPLADAAQLCARGMSQVPVVDHGRALGVVTKDALAHALNESGPRATIAMAEQRRVITVSPSASASEVLDDLRAQPDAVALVVDHGAPVGLLTVEQLEDYLLRAA